ncbi:hypothetical protein [Ralstonia solanacearum]|uniref:hypothetical protein n=1 Tax=Ralstonia solanacearum TaxID=305 RepID=UPI001E3D840A|nr:hypothetical protein [Ralstonia solanacearum]
MRINALMAKVGVPPRPPLTAEPPSRFQPQIRHKQQRDAEGRTEEDAFKGQG